MATATTVNVKRSDFGQSAFVNPNRLKIDANYQRTQKPAKIRRMVNNFNPQLCEPLTVSRRMWLKNPDDFYWVLDGGHRLVTQKELGVKEVWVRIIDVSTKEQEAVLFTELNDERVTVQKSTKHRALVFSGDATACAIEDAMNDVGFKLIGDRDAARELKTVACMYDIWTRGESSEFAHPRFGDDALSGERLIKAVLQTIDMTWAKKDGAFNNNTLKAQAIFLTMFWDKIDHETFVDVMEAMLETTPNDLHVQASRKSSSANNPMYRALAFTTVYNRTHGTKLRTSLFGEDV